MAKYRIESVKIEGFKAFTKPRLIDISGNIVFIFGNNGNGKSSVIEAIRWCLSGGEKEETLRNTLYVGDCCVEVNLKSADGLLTIHRRLRQGLGKSDVKVYTSDKKDVNFTDIFPYTSRLVGQGVYILAASQVQPPGRQRADITQFGPVLYEYLGLTEIREIIATIREILELCETDKGKLDAKAEELKRKLQDQLSEVDKKLQSLVTADVSPENSNTAI
jgi:DNA repair ATPase RecN